MRQLVFVIAILALAAVPAATQTTVPAPTAGTYAIAWDQAAPSLAEAVSYRYIVTADGLPLAPQTATCARTTSPFECRVPFPALTPGNHVLVLTATVVVNGETLASAPSAELQVRLVPAPVTPQNLRVAVP